MHHRQLAEICKQIYTPNSFQDATEIGGQGAWCTVLPGHHGRPAIVAFRGTMDVAGWIDDLNIQFTPTPAGQVHAGFQLAWQVLKLRVQKALDGQPCIVTGHSLGGAMATLAALDLPALEVVTFGSPRVGGRDFAGNYPLKDKTTRYVYHLDPIPLAPGLLAGYRHVCPATWHDGEEFRLGYDFVHIAKLAYAQAVNYVQNWGNWQHFVAQFWEDHAIENYVEALA